MKRSQLKRKTSLRGDARNLKPKACSVCAVEFAPRIGSQRYCSPACAVEGGMRTYDCAHCGETFRRSNRQQVTKYCSQACRVAHKYGQPRQVQCLKCEQLFTTRDVTQKYCSLDCSRRRGGPRSRGGKPWGVAVKGESACRNCGKPAIHLHHVVPRSKSRGGIDDLERNGIPLCHDCHHGWHHRSIIIHHQILRDEEFAFAVAIAGGEWVLRNYPDNPIVELLQLDELANKRRLEAPGLGLPFGRRLRATEHLAADVDPRFRHGLPA